jgi:hypothetical protein
MKVGDLVKHFLTDQLGIIIEAKDEGDDTNIFITVQYHVLWTTQGQSLSLFGAGHKEWCCWSSVDLVGGVQ